MLQAAVATCAKIASPSHSLQIKQLFHFDSKLSFESKLSGLCSCGSTGRARRYQHQGHVFVSKGSTCTSNDMTYLLCDLIHLFAELIIVNVYTECHELFKPQQNLAET